MSSLDQLLASGLQLHQAGRFAEAEGIYRQVLAQQPDHPTGLYLQGALCNQVNRPDVAVDLLQRALRAAPEFPEAWFELGNAFQGQGRFNEAIDCHCRAVELKPDLWAAANNLGNALQTVGRFEEAVAACRQALEFKPDLAEGHNGLGNALLALGRLDEALAAYQQAIRLKPDYAAVYHNIGHVFRAQKRFDEAIDSDRQALAIQPNFVEAHNNLGVAFDDKGEYDSAIAAFRQALALRPTYLEAQGNLAYALTSAGRLDEAFAAYRQALALNPRQPQVHYNFALALLLAGEFARGWLEYEWRWQAPDFPSPRRDFAQPLWNGSDLTGRTILLHAEQGFGDAIQFFRYVPLVVGRGGRIVIECQRELVELFRSNADGWPVLARGDPLPHFDVHCPFLSLPLAFWTTLESIPRHEPSLRADPGTVRKWQERLAGDAVKVGLAWAGRTSHRNDRHRSIAPSAFGPLLRTPVVAFHSLQKGPRAAVPPEVIDWSEEFSDFADTAALIANLDLVISVDTAVAHLAAAMGKPTWILLPYNRDWRWLTERDDSPWYPTVRLFRQQTTGGWEDVVRRVGEALERDVLATRRATS